MAERLARDANEPPAIPRADSDTMRYAIALSTVAGLCACAATPAELRSGSPALELTSSLSPKDVALCIADHWEGVAGPWSALPVTMRPIQDGYMVSVSSLGMESLVDVKSVSTGSKTGYFEHRSEYYYVGPQLRKLRETIRGSVEVCQ